MVQVLCFILKFTVSSYQCIVFIVLLCTVCYLINKLNLYTEVIIAFLGAHCFPISMFYDNFVPRYVLFLIYIPWYTCSSICMFPHIYNPGTCVSQNLCLLVLTFPMCLNTYALFELTIKSHERCLTFPLYVSKQMKTY